MSKHTIEYTGNMHCLVRHGPSGKTMETDAPVEVGGLGQNFSPTDLVAVALGACIASVLGPFAERRGWDLRGMRIDVTKVMEDQPVRRIAELKVEMWLPLDLPEADKKVLEAVALKCPVHRSLREGVATPIQFHWGVQQP
jgi:uncharacterized OsmC-like protein